MKFLVILNVLLWSTACYADFADVPVPVPEEMFEFRAGTLQNLRVGITTLAIDSAGRESKCPHGYQELTVTTPDGFSIEFECAQFSVTIRTGDRVSVNTFLEYGDNLGEAEPDEKEK